MPATFWRELCGHIEISRTALAEAAKQLRRLETDLPYCWTTERREKFQTAYDKLTEGGYQQQCVILDSATSVSKDAGWVQSLEIALRAAVEACEFVVANGVHLELQIEPLKLFAETGQELQTRFCKQLYDMHRGRAVGDDLPL